MIWSVKPIRHLPHCPHVHFQCVQFERSFIEAFAAHATASLSSHSKSETILNILAGLGKSTLQGVHLIY